MQGRNTAGAVCNIKFRTGVDVTSERYDLTKAVPVGGGAGIPFDRSLATESRNCM